MATNQDYLASGERLKVKWARQVDMDEVDKDDMCADGRYVGIHACPRLAIAAGPSLSFPVVFASRMNGGVLAWAWCNSCRSIEKRGVLSFGFDVRSALP